MSTILVKKDLHTDPKLFEGDFYEVDISRKFGEVEPGDIICYCHPFSSDLPLKLKIAIRINGDIIFMGWEFYYDRNHYLHTDYTSNDIKPTSEQVDTVNGLWSGRIRFEGLKLAVGKSLCDLCTINIKREEELIGRRIYLN